MKHVRLHELDAARGVAMLLVCMSHFVSIHFVRDVESNVRLVEAFWAVSKLATPTFVLVSGILMGYQFETAASAARFRMHVLDRALFLVTIVHMILALLFIPRFGFWRAVSTVYITDILAFCIVVGRLVLPVMGGKSRLILGGICAAVDWFIWQFWAPADPLAMLLKTVFVGSPDVAGRTLYFPLLPWVGWYLVGSSIGGWLNEHRSKNPARSSRRLGTIGVGMIAVALAIKTALVLQSFSLGVTLNSMLVPYFSPFQKYPPGLGYLLVMGGGALVLLSVFLSPAKPAWLTRFESLVEPIGKNSLLVFMAQYFLYFTIIDLFVGPGMAVPLTVSVLGFAFTLLGIWAFARLCQRYKASRFLTMGLSEILHSSELTRAVRVFRRAA